MRFPPRINSHEVKLLAFSKCPNYFKNKFNKEQNSLSFLFFSVGPVYSGILIYTLRFGSRVTPASIIFDMHCIFHQQY